MNGIFKDKNSARNYVWQRLETEFFALEPFPVWNRIPNFKGAEAAARKLFRLEPWSSASSLKIGPDSALVYVRVEALRRGIKVYVPTPRLAGAFMLLDPEKIVAEQIVHASARENFAEYSKAVGLSDLPHFDGIVAGSVAVTKDGRRAGKGAGYSDLEFALLRELGHSPVPVATIVHEAQIVEGFPVETTDQRLHSIATPSSVWLTGVDLKDAPSQIEWSLIDRDIIASMPPLQEIYELAKQKNN